MGLPGARALAVLVAAAVMAWPGGQAGAAPADGRGLAAARAEAARLEAEVDRLDTGVELLAEDYDDAQARLDDVIQAAHRQQAELERSETELDAARAEFAVDVRDLYVQGPTAPLELLLAARDPHELAVARGVAGNLLDRDRRAIVTVAGATAAVGARVAELQDSQARAVDLRRRLGLRAAAIQQRLDRRRLLLATARADVRHLLAAERARREAAMRSLAAAAAARALALGFDGFADVPAPNATAAAAVRAALGQLGKAYRWGATGPDAFDCSGLTGWAYARAGLALPRTSRQQWSAGRHVGLAQLRPGDLVFWASDPADPGSIHHVGLYVGQGLMVDAPHTGARVRVEPLHPRGYAGATRPTERS
jgi:cell wall-associated NlpC family hydrolase